MSSDPTPGAVHIPVMLREVLQNLELKPGLMVVDGTVGAGGHSSQIVKRIGPEGFLLGLDRDPYMLSLAQARLVGTNHRLVHASYAELPEVLTQAGMSEVDRILLDLGLSSDQLAADSRGFSFSATGLLDLRFDTTRGHPACEWLQGVSEEELTHVLQEYGEEPFARQIAAEVCRIRRQHPIQTAQEFTAAIHAALPRHLHETARKDPATRAFQALRIAVNQELTQLENALSDRLWQCLRPEGLLAIITFHSLEDRLVKQAFRDQTLWHNLTPRPIPASPQETRANPRSRTAKLRVAKKRPPL